MAELKPTYGNFVLRGEVVWKKDNSYIEDTSANGNLYRRINFGVKTEEDNIVEVNLFQPKFDNVTLRNNETKERDQEVPYGEHTKDLPDGYSLFMPIKLGLEQDEDGKNIKKELITYDATKYINEHLENGQAVFIVGGVRSSKRERDGEASVYTQFEPRGIYLSSIQYGDEGFESQSTFDQHLILTDSEISKDKKKLFVNANVVINKHGEFVPVKFYIDATKYKKLAVNVKKLKFGTELHVEGIIHHTVETKEIEGEADEWGESPTPQTSTNVVKTLEITKVKKPEAKDIGKFSPDDFIVKKESNEDNPFSDDSDDGDGWSDSVGNNEDGDPDDPFAGL